jgi:hypothetical protein
MIRLLVREAQRSNGRVDAVERASTLGIERTRLGGSTAICGEIRSGDLEVWHADTHFM